MGTKEYLPKNPNEYNLDGKRYIEKIRCACKERKGEVFSLYCRIHQRGRHFYEYRQGDSFISKEFDDDKRLFLSDDALNTVLAAIGKYKEKVAEAKQWHSLKFPVEDFMFSVYCRKDDGDFIYFLEFEKDGKTENRFFCDLDALHRMLFYMQHILPGKGAGRIYSEKYDVTRGKTDKNPFYSAALEQEDKLFTALLRRYYRMADNEECLFLSEILEERILPALPEAFNRDYCIVAADDIDYELLLRSGYMILHNPVFSMKGYTHDKITLNPCKKRGLDAGAVDRAAITFQEFLKLFEDASETESSSK